MGGSVTYTKPQKARAVQQCAVQHADDEKGEGAEPDKAGSRKRKANGKANPKKKARQNTMMLEKTVLTTEKKSREKRAMDDEWTLAQEVIHELGLKCDLAELYPALRILASYYLEF
eukprot:504127-Karenia_brevis.AAC.1